MEIKRDLPAGMKTRVIIRADEDGRQVVTDDQGEELIEFIPTDPHLTTIIDAPDPEYKVSSGPYQHPTRASHEKTKSRRKMAKKSRKINRRNN